MIDDERIDIFFWRMHGAWRLLSKSFCMHRYLLEYAVYLYESTVLIQY